MAFIKSRLLLKTMLFCLSCYGIFSLPENFHIGGQNDKRETPINRRILRHAEIINPRARPRTIMELSSTTREAPAEEDLVARAGLHLSSTKNPTSRTTPTTTENPCESETKKVFYDPARKECREPPKGWTLLPDNNWQLDKNVATEGSDFFSLQPPKLLPIWDERVPKYKVPYANACDDDNFHKDFVDPEEPVCLAKPGREFTVPSYTNPWAFERYMGTAATYPPATRYTGPTRKPQKLNKPIIYDHHNQCKVPFKFWKIELNDTAYNWDRLP